jgi:hypothetical protein
MGKSKPTLSLDFDGVVHQYSSAFTKPEEIHDDVVPGFFEWAEDASRRFELVIYSTRSETAEGRAAMTLWLIEQRRKWRDAGGKPRGELPVEITFSAHKPKAFLMVDDRAVAFDGDWSALDPDALMAFRPWNRRVPNVAPKAASMNAVHAEVIRARTKFPGGKLLLPALVEEVGELAQALLQQKPPEEILKEAVQVACVAIRIMEEGCPEFADLTPQERDGIT